MTTQPDPTTTAFQAQHFSGGEMFAENDPHGAMVYAIERADRQLRIIQRYIDGEKVKAKSSLRAGWDWGHVGSMNHVVEMLDQITSFIR